MSVGSTAEAHPQVRPPARLRRGDIAVAVFTLLFAANAFTRLVRPRVAQPGVGDPWLAAVWLLIGAWTVTGLVRQRQRLELMAGWPLPLLVVPALALLSTAWSSSPFLTVERSISLAVTWAFGYYLAVTMSIRQLVTIIGIAVAVVAVATLGLAVATPADAVDMVYPAALRGPFSTKNELGRFMVLGLIVVFVAHRLRLGGKRPQILLVILLLGITILAGSASALIIAATLVLFVLVIDALRSSRRPLVVRAVITFAGAIAVPVLVLGGGISGAVSLLGRDDTFSGRKQLWAAAWESIHKRPLTGYGYGAFWQGENGPSSDVLRRIVFDAPHSHNGFLDLVLQVGLLGLVVVAVVVGAAVVQAVRQLRRGNDDEAMFGLALLGFIVIYNLTESGLFSPGSAFTALTVCSLYRVNGVAPRRRLVEGVP